MIKNDEYFMLIALEEAKKAYKLGEIPVGAVIVNNSTHEIVSRSHNLKEFEKDVTAHAEMLAIREANKKISNWRLDNHTIYVTLEPCVMCGSAILQSRIDRLVIGALEPNMGSFGSKLDLTKLFKTNIAIINGVLQEDCKKLLTDFFENKR